MKKPLIQSAAERKRLFEILAMVATTLVLLVLSRLEETLFNLSERLSENKDFIVSVFYFGLININVVLILVLSFLIFRNVVKLVIERKRGVIGSRLRTKLVIALVFFAVAPTTLLFYVSTRFLTESFDTWFSSRVETTINKTREAGALVYKRDERRIESLARIALQRVDVEPLGRLFEGAQPLLSGRRLDGFQAEHRLYGVKLYNISGQVVWSGNPSDRERTGNDSSVDFVLESIDRFQKNPGLMSRGIVEIDEGRDVVKGIAPVHATGGELAGVVLVEERFETQIMKSVEAILKEFSNLKPGAQLIRLSYLILLIVIVLIIVFSATWLGFYVARGIIGPIQNLAEATREVALGNYDITLEAKTDDETGQLVRAFNSMIKDLKKHEDQVLRFTKELEETNEELDRRRKYMEVVLKNISAGVLSADADGRLTSINTAAERLLGIKGEDAVGKPIKGVLGAGLWQVFWEPIVERLQGRLVFNGQIELEAAGRELTLIADASRIFDENSAELGVVVVFDDAGEQVKAQRVAAWREVARRIAHEIKNPITPIKLSAQRLLRRFGNEFEGENKQIFASCVETIVTEVDGLRDLVNEFSKFSRLPTVKTRPMDINEIIRDVAGLFAISYPHIHFDLSGLSSGLPLVPLDREQMSRVFTNLINNALASIAESGNSGEMDFRTLMLENANAVRIEIADNGTGIPDKLKSKVMEPYFSTKSEGTGLGLAIVAQIISDHGGYLRIQDNHPSGAVIVMELPLGDKGRKHDEVEV